MSLTAVLPRPTAFPLRHSATPRTPAMHFATSFDTQSDPSPLRTICCEIRQRVDDLLKTDASDDVLRDVQRQTRASLAVIEEALERYS